MTLTIDATGNGNMAVGAVSVVVNLGALGVVTLSAPAVTTIGYISNTPLIAIPLFTNTTVLLAAPGIPTLSTWAMVVLVAVMLGAGLVFLRRRRYA